MKRANVFLVILISCFFISCSSDDQSNSSLSADGLEIIKVDLSEARTGKLSEFFEPEIEYIWLKDDSEEAQLSAGLQKIFFHGERILTLDIFGCRCIKVFDRAGKYLSKIRAYGEGPGKYLDFDDAIVVNGEVLLLGVFPPKQMWFSVDGKFLREEKLAVNVGSGVYSETDRRYYFYNDTREPGNYLVESVNEAFEDTLSYFPFSEDGFYGSFPVRNNFRQNENSIYLGRPFNDTIWMGREGKLLPKLVFDFGGYAQDIEELKDLNPLEELEFINSEAKLYFLPSHWFLTDSQL